VVIQHSNGESLWESATLDANASEVLLPVDVLGTLTSGAQYTVVVTGVSHAGQSTSADARFVIDFSPPVVGRVYSGQALSDVSCHVAGELLHLTWSGVIDPESSIASIEWAVGSPDVPDAYRGFSRLSDDFGVVPRSWLYPTDSLQPGAVIVSTLRVRNRAGDTTLARALPVRVVPRNCSATFTCMPILPFMETRTHQGIGGGVHPMLLPLVMSWLYDVKLTNAAPGHHPTQKVSTRMAVRIHQEAQLPNGSRVMRLAIEEGPVMEDAFGSRHAPSDGKATAYPLYYVQDANGTVLGILHHPDDPAAHVMDKKLLATGHQLVLLASPLLGRPSEVGLVNTTILKRTFMVRRMRHIKFARAYLAVALSTSSWRTSPHSSVQRYCSSRSILTRCWIATTASSGLNQSCGCLLTPVSIQQTGVHEVVVEGAELLPTEPGAAVWTLRRIQPPSLPRSHTSLSQLLTEHKHTQLWTDEPLELGIGMPCLDEQRNEMHELIDCMAGGDDQVTGLNPIVCMHRLVRLGTQCPELGVEDELGDILQAAECTSHCDRVLNSLGVLQLHTALQVRCVCCLHVGERWMTRSYSWC